MVEVSIQVADGVGITVHSTRIFRVFVDDKDLSDRSGGGGYAQYGIDAHAGAVVVVRPDGYVGMVASLDGVDALDAYFSAFMM